MSAGLCAYTALLTVTQAEDRAPLPQPRLPTVLTTHYKPMVCHETHQYCGHLWLLCVPTSGHTAAHGGTAQHLSTCLDTFHGASFRAQASPRPEHLCISLSLGGTDSRKGRKPVTVGQVSLSCWSTGSPPRLQQAVYTAVILAVLVSRH